MKLITAPKAIPVTVPRYIPMSARPNTNANNAAKIISKRNALKNVKAREIVPFPMAWKRFPAKIPNGMNNKKKHNIRIQSTTPEDNTEALAEYEKINDRGSANKYKNVQIIVDDIKPNFKP